MLINEKHLAELNSPVQTVNARVELHSGSTLVQICTCKDYLSNFTIERVGEGKFFGYGISHKLIVNFMDPRKELNLTNIDFIEVTFGVDGDFIYPFPTFHILEVERDEATNDIKVVAFDSLYQAANHRVSELGIISYTIEEFVAACSALLEIPMKIIGVTDDSFKTYFVQGANFDGSETIRQALDAAAEATQTIYYMSGDWELTFKRLDQVNNPVLTIDRNQYIDLKSGANCTLGAICHVTELGDNIAPPAAGAGVTQYIRENPFYDALIGRNEELRAALLNNAIAAVGGSTINPFECNWIGNYLLEIGDKIALVREDGSEIITYIVDDSITFDGTLGQSSRWEFISDEAETESNPSTLGDALNQTFARVDKVNKQITLLVQNKTIVEDELKTIKENQTSFTQTADQIALRVESIETDGVTKVDTGTGFTFNEEGLRINKDNSGIENLLDNTGMYVKQDGAEVLSANEVGVKAKDLHAVTYLWIGSHSRFEDYEGGRTGCFWIGE